MQSMISESTPEERATRKRYLLATLVTCISVVMVGSVLHVVKLGTLRLADMQNLSSIDASQVKSHIRAAGEEITTHEANETGKANITMYTAETAQALLPKEKWAELDSIVSIPAGSFRMGTSSERADEQNGPEHVVDLPAYRIDKFPVTNAQYARFVAAKSYRVPLHWKGGRIPQGLLEHPVTMVTWSDAVAFCKWENKRLPTEAEYEKAARGTDGRNWPWGNNMDPARLNTYNRIGNTTPVNRYPEGKSPYGVMDMAGNVNEWTSTDFLPYPGSAAPRAMFDPTAGGSTTVQVGKLLYKVLRGGTWKSDPFSTQTFHRNFSLPNYASDFYGFRCAMDAK